MLEDPAPPRRGHGAVLIDLAREDLELYGVEELQDRIERLQAEIGRTQAQMDRKKAGRAAADALFRFGGD
jgi:uncharacterized small protein (DUF1192 family)